jgi:hypothetical protein
VKSAPGARLWAPPLAAVLAATALLARRTVPVGWVGHDTFPIVLTSRVASWADLARLVSRELMDGLYTADFYRPLFGLSIAIDHALWGLDARGYQITSVLLYGAGGWVVFLLARRLLGPDAVFGPLVATVAYLAHPSHIEVVPVPARRPDLLCWLFAGLALWLQRSGTRRSAWLAAGAGFLAMMSKETGLLVPLLALLAALVLDPAGRRVERLRNGFRSTAPLWFALALAVAIRFAVLGGIGGHGETVRGASLDRIPSALLAVWALLVAPQPVAAAGVVGSPWVAAWSAVFVPAAALVLARGSWRNAAVAACWLAATAGLYAVAGGIQVWYLVLPLACFALLLGAAAESARSARRHGGASRAAGAVLLLAVAVLLVWQGRYSPLVLPYDGWERAARAGDAFREEIDRRVAAAPEGTVVQAPPRPDWLPVEPGTASLRGASILAPYSVEAWLSLRFPSRRFRVTPDPSDRAGPGETLVVTDRILPGFDARRR